MSANTTIFPVARVTPNARHALGGMWRLQARRFFTVNYWLMLAGMLTLLVVFSMAATGTREAAAREFVEWAAAFYGCFLLPVLTFVTSAGAMRDDLGAGTVDYIFTRPVRRPVYVAFRYLVQMGSTQIDFLFAFAVVAGIGMFWDVPGLGDALPWLFVTQVLAIAVFTAVGTLCGLATSRYIIVGLGYGFIVEMVIGNVPTQLNQASLVRHLLTLLQPLLNGTGWAPMNQAAMAGSSAAGSVTILLTVTVAAVGLAALAFSRMEFAGAASRDN